MFTRFLARMELRRSTAFLLARQDDRLLDDIGLTRLDVEAMHLGLTTSQAQSGAAKFHSPTSRRVLSVAV